MSGPDGKSFQTDHRPNNLEKRTTRELMGDLTKNTIELEQELNAADDAAIVEQALRLVMRMNAEQRQELLERAKAVSDLLVQISEATPPCRQLIKPAPRRVGRCVPACPPASAVPRGEPE
jgi:hypothetical protein